VGALLIVICGVGYYFFMPVAEVATVRRGTAISAVYDFLSRKLLNRRLIPRLRCGNSGPQLPPC